MLSVFIPTINRSTLPAAITSGVREGCPVIVVSDGMPLTRTPALETALALPGVQHVALPCRYGLMDGVRYYGAIPFTVGAYLSATEFVLGYGDDDELVEGAGTVLRDCLARDPGVDLWIPGVQHPGDKALCLAGTLEASGSVGHAVYRRTLLAFQPQVNVKDEEHECQDYHHIVRCVAAGAKIAWAGQVLVWLRPKFPEDRGCGRPG